MNWLIKGSQAAGILLIAGGIISGIFSFINPKLEFVSIPAAIVLIITGIIVFAVSKFTYNMVKDLPKPPTLKESTARISSAADMMKQMNKMNRLSASGIPVRVKVLSFKDTGQLVNYDPVIEFQLEVLKEHKYDNYYINSHKQIVSKILTGRIETGKEYYAKVDPEDRNSIIVTFS
jgi:hypothetical protein